MAYSNTSQEKNGFILIVSMEINDIGLVFKIKKN